MLVGSVMVEALCLSIFATSDVLDTFEMESRILWNLRFVVLRAVAGIPRSK